MNAVQKPRYRDLDTLSRLRALSWLSSTELNLLSGALTPAHFTKSQVIFAETALGCQAHILLRGIARITCRNVRGARVTIALLPPGLIPEFPWLPLNRFAFRCEAYSDCRVGSLDWKDLDRITLHNGESAFKKFHEGDMAQWYRLLLRSSGCLSLGLHERLVITLLEPIFRLRHQRSARHASAGILQPPGYSRSRWGFAPQSYRTPGSDGARAAGYSARPALNCTYERA